MDVAAPPECMTRCNTLRRRPKQKKSRQRSVARPLNSAGLCPVVIVTETRHLALTATPPCRIPPQITRRVGAGAGPGLCTRALSGRGDPATRFYPHARARALVGQQAVSAPSQRADSAGF
ncbi:hypothetical protein AAHC03_027090 [Spirometra sp. Aus1]